MSWGDSPAAWRLYGAEDSEHFRIRLLEEVGVAVLADIHFGTRVSETEKVVLSISQTVRQIAGLQQQIATQITHLAESIRDVQDALDPTTVLKYDMLNEPYN